MFPGFYYVDANNNKFVYGVVYETGDKIKYFVPVSHYSNNKENNILIKINDYGKIIVAGSLRFNYMIPVPEKSKSNANLVKNSCDFRVLEEAYRKYNSLKI